MKLFVNGCSFSHGHNLTDDLSPKWVWPYLMSDFDEVANYAWLGGSNDRILRTTLDFFNTIDNVSEWIAVIQWTDPYNRTELYDEGSDTYIGYCLGAPSAVLGIPDHKKFISNPTRFAEQVRKYGQYSILSTTKKQKETNLIHQQLLLSNYFISKGINFLYTSMSSTGTVDINHPYPLAKLLPRENIIDPISRHVSLMQPDLIESQTDLHPNKEGHKVIARYITNELKQRNYL
jgi:hypothetical protein